MKDFGDPIVVADIKARLADLSRDVTIPCAERLDKLTTETVRLVYPHQKKQKRNSVCRDWTPDSVALEIHMKRVRMLEKLLGKPTDPTGRGYLRVVRYGRAALGKLARNPEQLIVFESLTQYNTAFWSQATLVQAREDLLMAMAELKDNLTDDMKQSRRRKFLLSIRKRNYEVQLGKIKGVVLMTLGSKKKSFKLESLKAGEEIIIEPGTIHSIVQQYMTVWFAHPDDGTDPPEWALILGDRHSFESWARLRLVPEPLIQTLWHAINRDERTQGIPDIGHSDPHVQRLHRPAQTREERIHRRHVRTLL